VKKLLFCIITTKNAFSTKFSFLKVSEKYVVASTPFGLPSWGSLLALALISIIANLCHYHLLAWATWCYPGLFPNLVAK
jgi:hypothetical protein